MEVNIFKGYTHAISSVALYLFVIRKFNIEISPLPIVTFIIIGSLIPDIDHPYSLLGRYFIPINLFMKHRGITHSIFGMLLFSLPLLIYNKVWFYGMLYGYFMHLLIDSLTPMGIKPFQPFNDYKIRFNLCRTGIEELAVFCLSLQYILLR